MGRIVKIGIERLGQRNFELNVDCPNCGSARIKIEGGNGSLDDTSCPKCGIRIILDALNLTMVNEFPEAQQEMPTEEPIVPDCG